MNLFFDSETIPDQREGAIDRYLAEVKPPGQYKKAESIDKWLKDNAESVAVENWKRGALHGIEGEIVSLAWAFDDRPVEAVTRSHTEPESDIIESFFKAIEREVRAGEGKHPHFEWVGHNIIEFDLRFLWQRCVILSIAPPVSLPIDARHDKGQVYDTMRAWAGWKGYEKQSRIVNALGGEDDEVDGSVVWDLVQAGLLDEVQEYNKRDVERVRLMYRRMTWAA